MPGDEHVKMTDSDGSSCSPSKRRRTETSSSSSLNSSSENSADEHCSLFASSTASSLTSSAVIDHCQPLSFFLTKVDGIQSKYNQSRALGIKGKILKCNHYIFLMTLVVHCKYIVTGPVNGPFLFCSLTSVVICCHLLSVIVWNTASRQMGRGSGDRHSTAGQ